MRGLRNVQVGRENRPAWQRLLLALALMAFAQAGYVTQTHIHPLALTHEIAAQKSQHKAPARDDPDHCPFCQEFLLAGAYLLPPPVILPLPTSIAVGAVIIQREIRSLVRFSHGWQSRGPPHLS